MFYASQCEVLVGSVFSQCHGFISPYIYQQHCRHQACRCGSSCLCTALAHYTYLCSKHGVHIDFRSQVSECGWFNSFCFFRGLASFSKTNKKIVIACYFLSHRCGLPWRNAVQLLCVLLWAVLPCAVWHGDM